MSQTVNQGAIEAGNQTPASCATGIVETIRAEKESDLIAVSKTVVCNTAETKSGGEKDFPPPVAADDFLPRSLLGRPPDRLVILGWGRSAVCPVGGALSALTAHEIAAPVIRDVLARAGVSAQAIDALVAGNALGAGGNPARLAALAAGLPDRVAAFSVDTQCCAGLDAVSLAAGLLHGGSARLVLAGGLEAWSRAPIRQHRPKNSNEIAVPYERPAFAPDPARDPDLLQAAARYALDHGISRERQDRHALQSHSNAMHARLQLRQEITAIGTALEDSYVRQLAPHRLARMPVAALAGPAPDGGTNADKGAADNRQAHAVSLLAVSPRADGAAFVLLATEATAAVLGLTARFRWYAGVSTGAAPEMPMVAAITATDILLDRCALSAPDLWGVELHDAFAVQALAYLDHFGFGTAQVNRHGGGLARGHPIGASGAVSLVRLLNDMDRDAPAGALGVVAIAGAGGIGAAAIIERL